MHAHLYLYKQNKRNLNIILKRCNKIEENVQKQIANELKKVFPFAIVIFIILIINIASSYIKII